MRVVNWLLSLKMDFELVNCGSQSAATCGSRLAAFRSGWLGPKFSLGLYCFLYPFCSGRVFV